MNKKKISLFLMYLIMFIVTVYYLTPILVLVSTSLKPQGQVLSRTWEWIPRTFTLDNYKYVLQQYPYLKWTTNSLLVTGGTVLLTLAISLPTGYAFARLKIRGKNLLFSLVLLTIMIPFFAYTPQLYLLITKLGLRNTYLGLIVPMSTSGVSIFLFRQFIQQLPPDLEEAAVLDGCSNWGIFFRVILPLTKPAITTSVIFTAVKSWNNLLWPLIASSDNAVKTLPVGLSVNVFQVETGLNNQPPYGIVMAAALLSIILPILLFIFLQRYFIQGIATTGLK
ncbi:MAG: carbohydrate ABC transporter permease [Anaerolineaceae bacterium]|jgi:ABC-type glycerol-3-phosphate transport system permease component|nr:MAG: carbohydrate ABC transporter permease [Anaerolineaceae bacterium]